MHDGHREHREVMGWSIVMHTLDEVNRVAGPLVIESESLKPTQGNTKIWSKPQILVLSIHLQVYLRVSDCLSLLDWLK